MREKIKNYIEGKFFVIKIVLSEKKFDEICEHLNGAYNYLQENKIEEKHLKTYQEGLILLDKMNYDMFRQFRYMNHKIKYNKLCHLYKEQNQ